MKKRIMLLAMLLLIAPFFLTEGRNYVQAEELNTKNGCKYAEVKNTTAVSDIDTRLTYCPQSEIILSQKVKEKSIFQKSNCPQFYAMRDSGTDFITDCSTNYAFNILKNSEYGVQLQELYLQMLEMMTAFYENTDDIEASVFDDVTGYCIGSIDYSQSALTTQEIHTVFQSVIFDHPLFYCIKGQIFYDGTKVYLLTDEEFAKGTVRAAYSQKIKEMVQSFDTENYQSNYEIAKKVHDTIIANADYAYEQDGVTPQNNVFVHSIAGYVAEDKKIVCDGYANTFAAVMNYMDVETILVTGYGVAQNSENYTDKDAHAWNLIALGNGSYYFVDVTWDDLGEEGATDTYLCMGSEMYETHKIIPTDIGVGSAYQYPLPECTGEQFTGTDTLKTVNDPAYTITYEEEPDITGEPCGENVFWKLSADGVMEISGRGKMWDFRDDSPSFDYHECPWQGQKDQIRKVIIGNGVTSVGAYAFNECHNLSEVTFGKSVLKLQAFAFYHCENLEDFILPARLTLIGDQVFAGCEKITTVSIPDRVNYLGANIFTDDIKLKSLYIGGSSDVGGYTFFFPLLQNCTSLERIEVSSDNIALYSKDGVLYSAEQAGARTLYQYPCGKKDKEFTLLPETVSISEYAINCTQYLEKITFSERLEEVQHNAILWCPSLKFLVFPETISSFGYGVGSGCDNLEYIENLSETPIDFSNWDTSYKEPLNGCWYYKYWADAETNQVVASVSKGKVIPKFFGKLLYAGDKFEKDGVTYCIEKSNLKDTFTPPSSSELANGITNGTVCVIKEDSTNAVPDKVQYEGWSYDVNKAHIHTGVFVPDAEPSCIITGNIAYYKCICGKCFSDKDCKNEISEESTFLNYKHAEETEIRNAKPATETEDGYTGDIYCMSCGAMIKSGTVIRKVSNGHKTEVSFEKQENSDITSIMGEITSIKTIGSKSIKLEFAKIEAAEGYQVEYSLKSNFKNSKKKKTNNTSMTIKKLKKNKKYYVRVRVYGKVNGKTYYGKWSSIKAIIVKLKKSDIVSVKGKIASIKNIGSKSMKLKFGKIGAAEGYQIEYSTKSNFRNSKKKKAKKTSMTVKKLKKNKKYYVRVRIYGKVNGKTYYGKWSSKKIVIIKR